MQPPALNECPTQHQLLVEPSIMKLHHLTNTPLLSVSLLYFLLSFLSSLKWETDDKAEKTDCSELFVSIHCHL